MNQLLRVLVVGGAIAFLILIVALGFARNDADLMAPVNLMMFFIVAAVYLLPTALAVYRGCKAAAWIVAIDVLLGWTIVGWIVALVWAFGGQARPLPPTIGAPPSPMLHGR